MQLIAIQMTSGADIDVNLAYVAKQLMLLKPFVEPALILLPENFALFSRSEDYRVNAEVLGQGRVQQQLADWAKQYKCWIVAGSLPIISNIDDRIHTTSLAFDPNGELVQHYHKIHLFDAHVSTTLASQEQVAGQQQLATQVYKESDSFIAGNSLATFNVGDIKVGMAICYDLRFPELFRMLSAANVDVILLPAAFTYATGKAHWLPLLQARAIENQCYLLAANQVGNHGQNRYTWGHSVILDPWGSILAQQTSGRGFCCAPLDKQKLVQIRTDMPILQHARFTASLKNKE